MIRQNKVSLESKISTPIISRKHLSRVESRIVKQKRKAEGRCWEDEECAEVGRSEVKIISAATNWVTARMRAQAASASRGICVCVCIYGSMYVGLQNRAPSFMSHVYMHLGMSELSFHLIVLWKLLFFLFIILLLYFTWCVQLEVTVIISYALINMHTDILWHAGSSFMYE